MDALGALVLKGCVALLSGYLAILGMVAHGASFALQKVGVLAEITPIVATGSVRTSRALEELPSHYEIGGAIPRILLDNLDYQAAAVAGTGTREGHSPEAPSPVEDALANIFCTYREGNEIHITTGSGVFIDSRGIILTNAHVAQFLLLGDAKEHARCVVRQGDPAEPKYVADVLYISPAWVHDNANLIDAEAPTGTGERDFALLYVSESLDGALPASFPFLPFSTYAFYPADIGTKARVAGYPAEILATEGPRVALSPKVATTTLSDFFTFHSGKADLISIAPTVVGEQGSSGGPIVSEDGDVVGLIVTKGNETKEGAHSLRALTIDYIDRAITEETGFDLATTLEGNIPRRSVIFKQALVPYLMRLLESELHN